MNEKNIETVEPTVSQKELYTGKYISLKVLTVEKHKGYTQREIVDHMGTIMTIVVTDDDKLVLTRIYRKSIEQYSLEVPSKKIYSAENHIDLIKNQVVKELGYEMINVKNAYSFYPNTKYSNEKVFVYVATVQKKEDIDDCTSFQIVEIPVNEIDKLSQNEDVLDGKTMVAINYIKENLENLGE